MSDAGRIRIVVVDDHHLFRAGVRAELAEACEVVGEAAAPAEAVAVIAEARPDVVLLDVHLPDGGGVVVLRGLAALGPTAPAVLALSVSDAAQDVVPMIREGALGYVTKTIDTADLIAAIRQVAAGDAYFSPRLAAFVLQAFSAGTGPAADDADPLESLTPREREVLHHLARGYAYKAIAHRLGIGTRTVESHVRAVLRKLQLSSRHEVSHWAAARGLLDDAPEEPPAPGAGGAGRAREPARARGVPLRGVRDGMELPRGAPRRALPRLRRRADARGAGGQLAAAIRHGAFPATASASSGVRCWAT